MRKYKEYALFVQNKQVTPWTTDYPVAITDQKNTPGSEVKQRVVTVEDPSPDSPHLNYMTMLNELKETLKTVPNETLTKTTPSDLELLQVLDLVAPVIGEAIAQSLLDSGNALYGKYGEDPVFIDRWDRIHDKVSQIRRITNVNGRS